MVYDQSGLPTGLIIDNTKYRGSIEDVYISMLECLYIFKKQHRGDYDKILKLAVIFLSGTPQQEQNFAYPEPLTLLIG